jgi:hypothetical protein
MTVQYPINQRQRDQMLAHKEGLHPAEEEIVAALREAGYRYRVDSVERATPVEDLYAVYCRYVRRLDPEKRVATGMLSYSAFSVALNRAFAIRHTIEELIKVAEHDPNLDICDLERILRCRPPLRVQRSLPGAGVVAAVPGMEGPEDYRRTVYKSYRRVPAKVPPPPPFRRRRKAKPKSASKSKAIGRPVRIITGPDQ